MGHNGALFKAQVQRDRKGSNPTMNLNLININLTKTFMNFIKHDIRSMNVFWGCNIQNISVSFWELNFHKGGSGVKIMAVQVSHVKCKIHGVFQ